MSHHRAHPFDDDKLKEECGIFGVIGVGDASNFVALGLHALQHRGQEAGGIVAYEPTSGFNSARTPARLTWSTGRRWRRLARGSRLTATVRMDTLEPSTEPGPMWVGPTWRPPQPKPW